MRAVSRSEIVDVETYERRVHVANETYNGLLGGAGELACTLLVEIDGPGLRAARLREWFDLPEHMYARPEDGTKVRPRFDASQRGEGRLSRWTGRHRWASTCRGSSSKPR
jgi:hypothetical protein